MANEKEISLRELYSNLEATLAEVERLVLTTAQVSLLEIVTSVAKKNQPEHITLLAKMIVAISEKKAPADFFQENPDAESLTVPTMNVSSDISSFLAIVISRMNAEIDINAITTNESSASDPDLIQASSSGPLEFLYQKLGTDHFENVAQLREWFNAKANLIVNRESLSYFPRKELYALMKGEDGQQKKIKFNNLCLPVPSVSAAEMGVQGEGIARNQAYVTLENVVLILSKLKKQNLLIDA